MVEKSVIACALNCRDANIRISTVDLFSEHLPLNVVKPAVQLVRNRLDFGKFKGFHKVALAGFSHFLCGQVCEFRFEFSFSAFKLLVVAINRGHTLNHALFVTAKVIKDILRFVTLIGQRLALLHFSVKPVNFRFHSDHFFVGFNVRPDAGAQASAHRTNVDMRFYRVIYDAIDEIEAAMKGMLAPKFKEVELGRAEVRNVFRITGVGMVAGCYVLDGKMQRNAQMRLLRDNIVIYDGTIASLQRFKDSVKEVATGYECGITFEKFQDIKEGDIIEAFIMEQIQV